VWVAFSAMHRARRSGKKKFISAGASVPGVTWNTTRTPSMVASWPVSVTSTVGTINDMVPNEVAIPRPQPIWPVALAGRSAA